MLAGEALTPRVLVAAPLILAAVGLIHMRQSKIEMDQAPSLAVHAPAGDD
jgi:hypothetical protein